MSDKGINVHQTHSELIWEIPLRSRKSQVFSFVAKQKPLLLKLYGLLYAAFTSQCIATFEYLANFGNIYDLIAEYTIRVISLFEMDGLS